MSCKIHGYLFCKEHKFCLKNFMYIYNVKKTKKVYDLIFRLNDYKLICFMIKLSFLLFAGIFIFGQAEAQIHPQLYSGRQEMFLEAESYHLFEEFNEALPLYLELLKDQPDNAFLNYRIGTCYLNIPGEKQMAIEYLKRAIEDMDIRDRRPTIRTTRAPLDALFFLANAYHIDYQFEKAIEMYERFRETLDPSIYNIDIVDEHIQASLNAINSTQDPAFFLEKNLGEQINTRFAETNPVVSGDYSTFVFSRRMQFYDGVFFSQKDDNGQWSWPIEITPQIGSDGDCYPVSLSYDGKELYLYKSDDLVGNIYVSQFTDGQWSTMKKLNENINTSYWESHASISKDGNTLYFTSNRPGGFGGLDIYYSKRDSKGDWGPAVNMGPVINTPYNEETPFITEDGRTIYFSSYGHYNIGGYDVFYSTLNDSGEWSEPRNAGYGISTPDDDLFFHPVKGGIYAYVSKFSDDGFGEMDIYRYEIFSDSHRRKFLVSGVMKRQDGLQTGSGAMISVVDPQTGEHVYSLRPHQITGEYEIRVESGDWELIFSEEGHEDMVKPLTLPLERTDPGITVDAIVDRPEPEIPGIEEVTTDRIILPEETRPPPTLGIEQHNYTLTEEKTTRISMRLDRNTILEIEKYLDGELIGTETIRVNMRRFNYDYAPQPGENILKFRYTDLQGDIITEEVAISYHPIVEDELLPHETALSENPEYLIKKFDLENESPEDLIRKLLPFVSTGMMQYLNQLVDEGKVPENVPDLIESIIDSADRYGFGKDELAEVLPKIRTDVASVTPDTYATDKRAPAEEDIEDISNGRRIPLLWILLLVVLLLAAFYFKDRSARGQNKQ